MWRAVVVGCCASICAAAAAGTDSLCGPLRGSVYHQGCFVLYSSCTLLLYHLCLLVGVGVDRVCVLLMHRHRCVQALVPCESIVARCSACKFSLDPEGRASTVLDEGVCVKQIAVSRPAFAATPCSTQTFTVQSTLLHPPTAVVQKMLPNGLSAN